MKKPKPHDTHQIVAVSRIGALRRTTILYGTEEECRDRLAHIRQQDVRRWNYRIEPLPEEGQDE